MLYAQGDILTPTRLTPGYIAYDENGLHEIKLNSTPPKIDITGIITPTFINSHTHLGDAFIRQQKHIIPHTIKEAVAPPDGLKHSLLEITPTKTIKRGIDWAIKHMIKYNTDFFIDFREGGLPGLQLLKQSLTNHPINGILLPRPCTHTYNLSELKALLKNADGIGISSISDWDYSLLQKIAETTHQTKKIFSIHASETHRENIDRILDLKPNFLIHMTQATENDLERVSDARIPIVICPRTNQYFNLKPPYQLLKKTKIILMLGTDNAMITPPNILKELHFLKQQTTIFTPEELLNMITYTPRKALNLDDHIPGLNLPRSFVVLHRHSLEPLQKIQWLRGRS
jgi:cytosine/adenosine deaminase-related metal-dependent hydrolase